MTEPEGYFRYWGKTHPKYDGEPKWYPLVYHCLDRVAGANSIIAYNMDFTRFYRTEGHQNG